MSDDWKYIIVVSQHGIEVPILFPILLQHDEIGKRAVSAGFVSIYQENGTIKVNAYGKSVSLELKSRKEDSQIIQSHIKSWNGD